MKSINTVLLKVFALEFFKSHAAFFLFAGGLCFGFMSGVEHKALAHFFVTSPTLLAIPFTIWSLYTWNIIHFNKKVLSQNQNEVIFNVALFNNMIKYPSLCLILFTQLSPIILYGLFLVMMAVSLSAYLSAVYALVVLCVLLLVSVMTLSTDINNPSLEVAVSKLKVFIDKTFSKSFLQFELGWVVRKHIVTVVTSKIFSCSLLFGVLKLYTTDSYDMRLLSIGILLGFSSMIPIVHQIHQFENLHLTLYRSLPISLLRRLLNFLLTYCLLSIPELGLLIRNFPGDLAITNLIISILFILSIGTFYYGLLYALKVDMDRYVKIAFYGVMITLVVLLFKVPLTLIVLAYLIAGIYLFNRHYYRFEYITIAKKADLNDNLSV